MGKKVNPTALRLVNTGWKDSVWLNRKGCVDNLQLDYTIRNFIGKEVSKFLYAKICIEQIGKKVTVTIHSHKPGAIIGKKGETIDKLRAGLVKLTGRPIELNVHEITNPDVNAQLIALSIAERIENRADYRKPARFALKSALRAGAEGCLIIVAGRLGGASIARTEKYRVGKVPLQSCSFKITMANVDAKTTYGICGVKVYISLGSDK